MKICFIGIGSIAKRHISNLNEISEEVNIDLQIDAVRRVQSEKIENINNIYYSFEDLPNDYDAIFITNPTEFHLSTLNAVNSKSTSFFIEKPLTSLQRINDVKNMDLYSGNLYYVACPLRYTNVMQYLKNYVLSHSIIGVRCICSSFLPEWRPGVDYRKIYSSHKDLGGGVSIDLIHEWDYLRYLFGMPLDIIYKCGKKSKLEMDCEDTAIYIAEYSDKFIELHLDYFGRKTIREIMLFTPEETIVGDLTNSKILFLNSGRSINFQEKRNDFQKKELFHFLDLMKTRISDNSIDDAVQTTLMTQGILEVM